MLRLLQAFKTTNIFLTSQTPRLMLFPLCLSSDLLHTSCHGRRRHLNGQDHRDLSERALIDRCLKNERSAWDEFFLRHIPTIKGAIQKTLKVHGRLDAIYDEDVIWSVHERVVKKLCAEGRLSQCKDPDHVKSFLYTIAENQTIDWLRSRGRRKNLPERISEQAKVSLQAPLGTKSSTTLESLFEAEQETSSEIAEGIERLLQDLSGLENEKYLWILRLSILLQMPLNEEEVVSLAGLSKWDSDGLGERLDTILKALELKEEKRIKDQGKAVLLWHEIQLLETKVKEIHKDPSPEAAGKALKLEMEIEEKEAKRKALLQSGSRHVRPSNGEIAEILRLPEDKVKQVSVLLIRAREMLRQKLGKHDPDECETFPLLSSKRS